MNRSLFRTVSSLFFALILLCTPFFCLSESHSVIISPNSYLNGRAKPSTSSEVTMKLYLGDEVEVLEFHGQWAKIIGGEYGTSFVKAEYLSSISSPVFYENDSSGRVRVRSAPVDGKTVGWVSSGARVRVLSIVMGWGKTSAGWVDLSFFQEVND